MSQCLRFDCPLLLLAASFLQVSLHFVFLTDWEVSQWWLWGPSRPSMPWGEVSRKTESSQPQLVHRRRHPSLHTLWGQLLFGTSKVFSQWPLLCSHKFLSQSIFFVLWIAHLRGIESWMVDVQLLLALIALYKNCCLFWNIELVLVIIVQSIIMSIWICAINPAVGFIEITEITKSKKWQPLYRELSL